MLNVIHFSQEIREQQDDLYSKTRKFIIDKMLELRTNLLKVVTNEKIYFNNPDLENGQLCLVLGFSIYPINENNDDDVYKLFVVLKDTSSDRGFSEHRINNFSIYDICWLLDNCLSAEQFY